MSRKRFTPVGSPGEGRATFTLRHRWVRAEDREPQPPFRFHGETASPRQGGIPPGIAEERGDHGCDEGPSGGL